MTLEIKGIREMCLCRFPIAPLEVDVELFLLCELDNDIETQNKNLEMKEYIQKYFSVSCISSVDFTEGNASSHRKFV